MVCSSDPLGPCVGGVGAPGVWCVGGRASGRRPCMHACKRARKRGRGRWGSRGSGSRSLPVFHPHSSAAGGRGGMRPSANGHRHPSLTFARTVRPSMVTVVPLGTGMGLLPIRLSRATTRTHACLDAAAGRLLPAATCLKEALWEASILKSLAHDVLRVAKEPTPRKCIQGREARLPVYAPAQPVTCLPPAGQGLSGRLTGNPCSSQRTSNDVISACNGNPPSLAQHSSPCRPAQEQTGADEWAGWSAGVLNCIGQHSSLDCRSVKQTLLRY